jgi:hypothetical protein
MTNTRTIRHAACGARHSADAADMLSHLLQKSIKPEYIVIIDDSGVNVANTTALIRSSDTFPFWPAVWDKGDTDSCLVSLALRNRIPFYCFRSFGEPVLATFLRERLVDIMVNLGGAKPRGAFLHAPVYGVLSVQAATLPYFRGNWATAFNLYLNEPLQASAFIMTPRIDDGVIVGRANIPVFEGDGLHDVLRRSIGVCADLVLTTLQDISSGRAHFERQQPWHLITQCTAMPPDLQADLADRLAKFNYRYYERRRA